METKICKRCKLTKPLDEFYLRTNYFKRNKKWYSHYSSYCKICDKKNSYERSIPLLYGITLETYHQILQNQNNKCAICKQEFSESPMIDHDHKTGAVRGLLCKQHNLGLGNFNDNPELLLNAYKYLVETTI